MLWPVVKALLGHYRRHPLQILLVWLGLTLGVSIFVGVAAVNQHARESYTDGERLFSNPLPYQIRPKNEVSKIPQGLYIQLRRAGFNQCVPVDEMHIHTRDGRDLTVTGLDTIAMLQMEKGIPLQSLVSLRLFQPPYPLMLSQELALHLGKADGDHIDLADGSQIGPVVVDTQGLLAGSRIVTDIAKLRSYNRSGEFASLSCGVMPRLKLERLRDILPLGLTVTRNANTELASLTQAFHMNLMAMGMLAFLVGMFIFYQAMSLSFVQRQPLVGILRQTGVSGWQLAKALLIELTVLILAGWLCGNLLGLVLANELIPTVSTTLADLYNANVGLTVEWRWQWSLQSLLMALVGASVACAWPLVRLLKSQPIRLTARLSLVRFAGREFLWQALCAVLLGVAALVLYQTPHTPVVGFVMVALLLLSIALLIPFVVFQVFSVLSYRLPWIKVRWFFADAAASMSYRGVAVMAFMLAMSANIAVETLVGSFRETTEQWLTQRLASDLYIYPTNSAAARVSNWLSGQYEVDEVWWRWEEELQTKQNLLQIVSTGHSAGEQEAITVKLAIPDYWYYLHNSRSVLISESMALKQGIRPGDTMSLKVAPGVSWQVAGIYYDYGNPYNQVMMSHANWLGLFAGQGSVGLAIQLKDGESPDKVVKSLKDKFHLSADRIFDNTNIHSQAMRVFDRTFIIADTLGNLTLVVAVFGIFFATVAGEMSKQRQVALLRCFGISGKELVSLSSLQLLLFGVLSALFAMPLGIGAANLMVEVVLRQSFGWTMPLIVIPWDYAETFLWTMVALLVAGAIPVAGIMRRTPMKSLRDAL